MAKKIFKGKGENEHGNPSKLTIEIKDIDDDSDDSEVQAYQSSDSFIIDNGSKILTITIAE